MPGGAAATARHRPERAARQRPWRGPRVLPALCPAQRAARFSLVGRRSARAAAGVHLRVRVPFPAGLLWSLACAPSPSSARLLPAPAGDL